MSDREIEQYVEVLAEGVPHVEAPLGAVLAAGRASAARRARRRGAGVLAGVVAAVAVVAIVPQLVSGSSTSAPAPPAASAPAPAPAPVPVPPAGTRFVGNRGVVMAVPDAWQTVPAIDAHCSLPRSDYVYLASPTRINTLCRLPLKPVPATLNSLEIATTDNVRRLLDSGADCGDGCSRQWVLDGVTFSAEAYGVEGAAVLEALGQSLQRLPEGWTTSADDGSVIPADDPVEVTAPAGTRLVGAGGVAIAVPESWRSLDPSLCREPLIPYVYVADPETFAPSCPAFVTPPEPVSGLEISTTDNVRLAGSGVECDANGCVEGWSLDGVSFSAYVADEDRREARAELTEIGASLRRLPEGSTTVPGWPSVVTHPSSNTTTYGPIPRREYVDLVEAAGLVVSDGSAPEDPLAVLLGPRQNGTSPGYGSVVPVGTTVFLDDDRS